MSSDPVIVDLMDFRLKKQGLQFSFIPSSKGYPLYQDPAAKGLGILPAELGDGTIRRLKNRYAPRNTL